MYNDKELDEYDTYLKVVKRRIQELNNRVIQNPIVLIYMIEIEHIKDKRNGDWEFYYHIETTPKVSGFIRHKDFHIWRLEKTQRDRDKKLKQLGI